ncbi:MAG: serine hydrolase, partial [Pseudonocardiaceae bacterium]
MAVAAAAGVTATTPEVVLGAAVLDRKTHEVSVNPAATVPVFAASLVKVLVAVDVLGRRHSGSAVSDRDVMLITQALGPSDDEAMNVLWSRFDGPGAVERVAQQLGLADTRPPTDPSQWGETLTSAHDVMVLYRHVLDAMAPADRDLIMDSIAAAPPIASDGFDQTFGLLDAETSADTVAKQGWMCCQGGRITLHSAGTVGPDRRFVVVLLSTQPRKAGYGGA